MKRVISGTGLITLGEQLRRINRIALAAALIIVAVIINASSYAINLFSLVESSQVKGRVLAENVSASLVFRDAGAAQELLQSLRYSPDVHGAALYGKDRQPFAHYVLPNHSVPASLGSRQEQIAYGIENANLVQPVVHNG